MTRLERERRRLGLSQNDLAFLVGRLAQGDISKFERRRGTPSAAVEARIAGFLKLDPETLLDEVDDEIASAGRV